MDRLVAHQTLIVLSSLICWLLALLARPAIFTVPHESFDDVRVQSVALAMGHLSTLSALERIVSFCHVGHTLKAYLAFTSVVQQRRWHAAHWGWYAVVGRCDLSHACRFGAIRRCWQRDNY